MDFDLTWLLWGLPITFGLGWLASRLDLRQWRLEGRQTPKAYFRGLSLLLNEQQDEAIDAFIEAVQNDPDTAELHFALGNLFRRRGDLDRAVRVHEHLLARGDLSRQDRERAQHALAQDFIKAGLLDRAESALHKLDHTGFETEAWIALLGIYERTRDWTQARAVTQKLNQRQPGSFLQRLAHFDCEEADLALRDGQTAAAKTLLEQALQRVPLMPRASLALAQLLAQDRQFDAALDRVQALCLDKPMFWPLAAPAIANWACEGGCQARALALLQQANQLQPTIDVTDALMRLESDPAAAQQHGLGHLQHTRSLVMAGHCLANSPGRDAPLDKALQAAIDQASAPLKRYRCAACAFEAKRHFWQCPGCQGWDSYPPRRIEEL